MATGLSALANPPLPAVNPARPNVQPAAEAPADKSTLPAPKAQDDPAHAARFDAAIAKARGYALPSEDGARIKDAVAALAASDAAKARAVAAQISDPIGRRIVEWYRLRAGLGTSGETRAFLSAFPQWPDRTLLTQRYEEAIFAEGGSSATIKDAFKGSEPRTAAGLAALASAYLVEGDTAKAKAIAKKAWREHDLAATLETGFLERFGKLLEPADHRYRLDRMLIDDSRWKGQRDARAAVARRIVPLLPEADQKKAEAQLAAYQGARNAAKLIAALPSEPETDWGLAYHRIQLLRRGDKHDEAWKLLRGLPTAPEKIVNPDDWWSERRVNAYAALRLGKPKAAFDLVKDAGPLSANMLKDQAFLAGWLALRYLDDAKTAQRYFAEMHKAADGPLSRAKAEYWLGRTHEALGDRTRAQAHYTAGAQFSDTFHGQLSSNKAGSGARPLDARAPAAPTAEEITRFNTSDVVLAAVVTRNAGLDYNITRVFLGQAQRNMTSEAETAMAAHLAEALGDTQTAVRIGKAAIVRGFNLRYYAYPVHPFPSYAPLRAPPETAMLLAIARQESEFDTRIVSGAGARGILQVMPITARHVCRDYKVKCDIPRLLTDSSYNTMMASAYIGDRMQEFGGSYVLTLAGYNAGPGRARQWIREFGDPRAPGVDAIDWIHRIPFEETRDYVQKVLSNVQMYRARLGEARAMRLSEDLGRAKGATEQRPVGAARSAADAAR